MLALCHSTHYNHQGHLNKEENIKSILLQNRKSIFDAVALPAVTSAVVAPITKGRGATTPLEGLVMTAHSSTNPIPSMVVYVVIS